MPVDLSRSRDVSCGLWLSVNGARLPSLSGYLSRWPGLLPVGCSSVATAKLRCQLTLDGYPGGQIPPCTAAKYSNPFSLRLS